jgi:holo-[acyl-carrier protein] synthase
MIIGVGIDHFDVYRMQKDLLEKADLKGELFTAAEIVYCESKRYPAQHFAARFSAKEALFKAMGTGYREGMSWREIEVVSDTLGKPSLQLSGKVEEKKNSLQIDQIHLSLSHTKKTAMAIVIMERTP